MYGFLVTTAGEGLLARAAAGETLTITGVQVGKGIAAGADAAKALTALIDPVAAGTSTAPQVNGGQISMIVEYRNDLGGGLETGFELTEFGIMARAGDDSPTLLYYAGLGDSPQPVQPISQGLDVHRFPVAIAVTGEVSVTLGYPADAFLPAGTTVNGKTLPAVLTGADIPVSGDAGADSVEAALSKKADVSLGLGGTMTKLFASQGESYEDYCARVDALVADMPNNSARLVNAYPPDVYGNANAQVSILYRYTANAYVLACLGDGSKACCQWRMVYNYVSGGGEEWYPFEWVNPRLTPGVEYRTTQRYNGKPVYVKLVDFGALPNNSQKTVEYAGGDTTTRTIEAHGVMTGGYVIPGSTGPDSYPNQVLEIYTSNTEVGVISHTDRSGFTAQIVVKYWRTTD